MAGHHEQQAPLDIVLELARADHAGDPFTFRLAEQTYLLRGEGGAFESADFIWGSDVLEELERIRRPSPDREAMQRLGDRLRAFLESAGWAAHEKEIHEAHAAARPIHVTIRSAAAELYALPWELITLKSTGQHIGELKGCLIRYEWPGTESAPPVPDPPVEHGRILFAWSAAGGAVPADDHLRAIRGACGATGYPFQEAESVVPSASLERLREALGLTPLVGGGDEERASSPLTGRSIRAKKPVCVLHILCHGSASGASGGGFSLMLGDGAAGGGAERVDAGALRQILAPHVGSLRLVVLCACSSGSAEGLDSHLGSIAQCLHRIGIPAVVASRYLLSVEGSIALTEALYNALLGGLTSLEEAFLAARERLSGSADRIDWASLQLYARAEGGKALRPFEIRPYRGLSPFLPTDKRFFFGRDGDVERLLSRLRSGSHLITVTGASGSGKSSLVMAGLLPALQAGKLEHENIDARVLRPGPSPVTSLAAAIELEPLRRAARVVAANASASPSLVEDLKRRPEALAEAALRLTGGAPRRRLLLVIDQFEELFTVAEDTQERTAFINCLLHATSAAESPVRVILTVRADFLGHCFSYHHALAERIGETIEAILPMRERDVISAISRPAELVGLRFEDGLVDSLVDDLRAPGAEARGSHRGAEGCLAPDDLPLLQFALEALWERRHQGQITWDAWRAIGGVRGLIARRADEVLASFATDEERDISFQLFARLVRLGEGAADTSRPAAVDDVEAIAPGWVGVVLDRWVDSRLLTTDGDGVRVTHEALIREWGTLRRWISERREALSVLAEIDQSARRWEEGRRSPDELWRGKRLARARELSRAHRLALSPSEAAFLDVAEAAQKRETEEAEVNRRRAFEDDFRVGGRERTIAAVFLLLVVYVPSALIAEKFPPSNATVAKTIAGMCAALALFLAAARRRFLANRISRLSWLTIFIPFAGVFMIHVAAERLGASVSMALVADCMLVAASVTVFVLTSQRAFWVSAAGFFVTGLITLGWPERTSEITLPCIALTLIGNTISLARASRSTSSQGDAAQEQASEKAQEP